MRWTESALLVWLILSYAFCDSDKAKLYELDFEKLGHYYHRATVMAFFKAKARTLLKKSSKIEQIVFLECAKDALTASKYAKCIVPLLDERDRQNSNMELSQESLDNVSIVPQMSLSHPPPDNRPLPAREAYEIRNYPLFTNVTNMRLDNFGAISGLDGRRRHTIRSQKRVWRTDEVPKTALDSSYPAKTEPLIAISAEKRKKRKTREAKSQNLRNLQTVRRYYEMSSACSKYLSRISNENDSLYKQMRMPVKFFNGSKMSIMSPKLLSILPTQQKPNLLSPSLLSFQKDGLLSLPEILQAVSGDKNDADDLLDFILEISGASQTLENLVNKMEPEIKQMENEIYPRIQEMQRIDRVWHRVSQTYNPKQKQQIKDQGYAFLEADQLALLYSSPIIPKTSLDLNAYSQMSDREKENRIENDIRHLAALDRKDTDAKQWPPMYRNAFNDFRRFKRQEPGHPNPAGPPPREETSLEPGHDIREDDLNEHYFDTLKPFWFSPLIGRGAALEVVTLSPHAFVAEIMFPEALTWHTLVPRAFIASVLSPNALVGRLLSPSAFRTEVLSPRALTPFILSPEAFMIDILSPKFLEARVLSPEVLVVKVLSPNILNPFVGSPEAVGVLVLSPTILSPKFRSEGSMMVEILSGDVEEEEEKSKEKEKEEKKSKEEEKENEERIHENNSRRSQYQIFQG
ncbi:hypothetical protein L596_016118 [Steinernema carpocapsae]|uniref:Uncharacterized protein n=1 Tax=Steinernema carpocapsae TaxID=34508 RepID=A0A4U5NI13_STECR|nr:hypothetical protein L596_016118 [Steinernema carpocapsae]